MKRIAIALMLFFGAPALADVPSTVKNHVLPGYSSFAESTAALTDNAMTSCDPAALRPAYNAAFDAWMAVSHLRFGPVEEGGNGLAIAYWPDPKGIGAKAQKALLTGDPAALTPARFAEQSVAARGFFALERLLYPAEALPGDACPLIRATAADLARIAGAVYAAWEPGYEHTVLSAGEAGNSTYLSPAEVRQTLYTQVIVALEFDLDQRLARPLGTFDKPFPERAEAVASGRSARNLLLSLQALRAMVATLSDQVPLTMAAFDRAIGQIKALDDPVFAGVADPQKRLKIEIIQQSVAALRDTAVAELGPALKTGIGFNAADGD